tara:strand:- start:437 stop:685 length:249 start_codon:yes stop_codon:yes gene_type:complete
MQNFFKAVRALNAVIVILTLFALALSSNVRSNLFELTETFLNSGPIGALVLIILLWNLRDIPSTLLKLIKAKGFNYRFWNEL